VKRLFLALTGVSLLLDQLTKLVTHAAYRSGTLGDGVRLIGDVLRVVYVENRYGVFGITYGPRFLYILLPLLGSVLVVWLGLKSRRPWSAAAYGILMGGAVGNLIDRIRLGYVIDFLVFELRRLGFRWYTFNVADACLVVGIAMLLGAEFLTKPRRPDAAPGRFDASGT
jgi:signal peptidase II